MNLTKERFKELGASLKEGREDFLNLAQAVNKLAEDAIKDIVSVEEVVVAEVAETSKEEEKKPEQPEEPVEKKAVKKVKKKPELPGDADEVEEEEVEEAEVKPVIKIVKKKVVVVRPREKPADDAPKDAIQEEASDDEQGEDFSIDLDKEEEEETEVPKVDQIMAEKEKEEKAEEKKEEKPPQDDTKKADIDQAYKKIQFVYNASVKLHEGGKDVSQIFEIMNMAENARQKGEMKMYIGLAGQLENMLISMQK